MGRAGRWRSKEEVEVGVKSDGFGDKRWIAMVGETREEEKVKRTESDAL